MSGIFRSIGRVTEAVSFAVNRVTVLKRCSLTSPCTKRRLVLNIALNFIKLNVFFFCCVSVLQSLLSTPPSRGTYIETYI
jgi:hypothetical protein